MNSVKDFLKKRKAVMFFVLVFLFGFVFGWLTQIQRVYENCVERTDGNPACQMYKSFF